MTQRKSVKLVNMTSTRIFMTQAENIFSRLRQDNLGNPEGEFHPTHMGGLPGQRDILRGANIIRETTVRG